MGSYKSDISEPDYDFKINRTYTTNGVKRVIILLDLDCFEVQLWMKHRRQDLIGKDVPVVVVNRDQIILSVNYTAKSLGVQRGKGRRALVEARQLCEAKGRKLIVIVAGERYGKVDTFLPMKDSDAVLQAILNWPPIKKSKSLVERSCRDEIYIDVTKLVAKRSRASKWYQQQFGTSVRILPSRTTKIVNTKVHPNAKYNGKSETIMEGRNARMPGSTLMYRIQQVYQQDLQPNHADEVRLVHGAIIAKQLIDTIKQRTNYDASAGIGHSKLTAKLAVGRNKPQGINIITDVSLPRLSRTIPFQELPGFAGITGENIRDLLDEDEGNETIHDLQGYELEQLISAFKNNSISDPESVALDLHNKCHFSDHSQVTRQVFPANFTTSLSFKGEKKLESFNAFKKAIANLSKDMKERYDYYRRMGRCATRFSVKAGMSPSLGRDGGTKIVIGSNELTLGKNNISTKEIYIFVREYLKVNRLNYRSLEKIQLTAGSILASRGR